jgi:hypothetical protein
LKGGLDLGVTPTAIYRRNRICIIGWQQDEGITTILNEGGVMNIEDIPSIPDREQRFEEITVDCYDEYEVLSGFEVYLADALQMPFAANWGKPGTAQVEPVTVLGAANTVDDEYEVLADQLWAEDTGNANAIVLDDYRAYVAGGGLPFDPYEEQ